MKLQAPVSVIKMFAWKLLGFISLFVVVGLLQRTQGEIADMEQEMITTEQMNTDQLLAWNTLFDSWLRDKFRASLKALHYKQDCIQCGDIYFVTRFYVDQTGHVSKYKIVREEIDCRGKTAQQNNELRKTITDSFGTWIFPPSLRNVIIEARMGAVTRC